MNYEGVSLILGILLAGGGIAGLVKSISIARNANKKADIQALQQTINTVQLTYQETISDLEKRIDFLENKIVEQHEQNKQYQERILKLEKDLLIAQNKIESLERELSKRDIEIKKRDLDIMRLEQQNIELRKQSGKRVGLEKDDNVN